MRSACALDTPSGTQRTPRLLKRVKCWLPSAFNWCRSKGGAVSNRRNTGAGSLRATAPMDLGAIGQAGVLRGHAIDVPRNRERSRQRRLWKLLTLLTILGGWLYWRLLSGNPIRLAPPHLTSTDIQMLVPIVAITLIAVVLIVPLMAAGRSPHVRYAASEIDVGFDDVVGLGPVKEEVVKTLNLFLAHQTFREGMGGNPRKAILFEGPPGTGKTYMAKAMAKEAGVPYLFVSSTAFQSMYYGQTGRKIRNYFKALRKAAREEGGAIGFIEEIDAIAGARSGMRGFSPSAAFLDPAGSTDVAPSGVSEGISGVVNELLIQLQSFDVPTFGQRMRGGVVSWMNRWLPGDRQVRKQPPLTSNILLIGATNRAADLDPALLRPGRFDRSIHFDVPNRSGRREIVDYYLDRKAHVADLDVEERREQLAAMTIGYTPVMLEHLLDEALVWSLREARDAMDWNDVQQAKLTEEIGLKQPVEYSDGGKTLYRDARSRTRGRRAPRRSRPQARGVVHREATRCARTARALRQGRTLDEDEVRAHQRDEDRVRRDDSRRVVPRRSGDRPCR